MTEPDRFAAIALHGRLDASATAEVDAQLRALAQAGEARVEVDLTEATYVSSSMLRILLLAHRRQEALGGCLILRNVPERILRILRVCGLDRILLIQPVDGPDAGQSSLT